MAYEPLHHKYRPQTFADLVGQEAIATTLVNALKTRRIAPAYLFTGARGTGKTSSARIMAKSLNCLASDAPTPNPCGVCELCRGIIVGNALDVSEIDAASNTGVDNIRELIERAQFAPVQARYKVYIIDEVHMLSTAAFNALLKTLEEPPDRVVFILATTDPQRVLPTIISRCQRFDFRRIPLGAMIGHLQKIADQEQIAIATEAVTLVAQISQGGLRDAESLLDQLSLLDGEISAEAVWDLVGVVPERDLLGILQAIAESNSLQLLEQVRRVMDRGREPLMVLQNLAGFYRDLLIARSSDRRDLVALTDSGWQKLQQLAKSLSMEVILQGQQHLRNAEVQLKNTTQPRLWLEITLLGLIPGAVTTSPLLPVAISKTTVAPAIPFTKVETPSIPVSPSSQPEEIAKTISAEITGIETTIKSLEVQPDAAVIEVSQASEDLSELWKQLMQLLPPVSRGLLADNGRFVEVSETSVKIGLKNAKLKEIAESRKAEIIKHCEQLFGHKIQLNFGTVSEVGVGKSSANIAKKNETQPKTSDTLSSQNPTTSEYSASQYSAPSYVPIPASSLKSQSTASISNSDSLTDSSQTAFSSLIQANLAPSPVVKSNNGNPISNSGDASQDFAIRNVANFFKGQIIEPEVEEEGEIPE